MTFYVISTLGNGRQVRIKINRAILFKFWKFNFSPLSHIVVFFEKILKPVSQLNFHNLDCITSTLQGVDQYG